MKRKHNISVDNLNPTFLFTWKGCRDEIEDSYHSHEHLELAYIMSGKGKYFIEGKMFDVQEGDLLILNPGVQHEAQSPEHNEEGITEFFVGVTDIALPGCKENFLPVKKDGYVMRSGMEFQEKVCQIFHLMEAENLSCMEGRYAMMKAYIMQVILLILREQKKVETPSGPYALGTVGKNQVVDQIVKYFQEHYNEKISLDQIAENMYLSSFYISKIFKNKTGDTPIHYLINLRLEKAKQMLEAGYCKNVQEVAREVGYDDVYHFSKLFKKRYGISPSAAQKRSKP